MNDTVLKNIGKSRADMLHAFIGTTFILEYGIIKNIPAKGIVTVEMSVADSADDIIITNCVYANLAGSSFSLNIKPNVDDKVMVFFPRKFLGAMFKKESNEALVSECGNGYSLMGGIAVPMNQYHETKHKNYIDLSDGNLTLKLAYDEENERNLFSLATSADGSLSLSLGYNEDEDKSMVELSAQADGNITLINTVTTVTIEDDGAYSIDNGKSTVSADKDGNITLSNAVTTVTIEDDGAYSIDNGKSTVSVDKNGNISIDAKSGKVTIKNSSANLFTILKGMLQILNSSLATAGSPANHTVVPGQCTAQDTQLGQLMQ
jgi:hypothetical protein